MIFLVLCYLFAVIRCQTDTTSDTSASPTACSQVPAIVSALDTCETGVSFCQGILGVYNGPVTKTVTTRSTFTTIQTTTAATVKSKITSFKTTTISDWKATSIWPAYPGPCTFTMTADTTIITPSPSAGIAGGSEPAVAGIDNGQCGLPDSISSDTIYLACKCFWAQVATSTITQTITKTSMVKVTATEYKTVTSATFVPNGTVTLSIPCLSTPTPCPLPDTTCDNAGLEWAFVPLADSWYPGDGTNPSNIYDVTYNPAVTKTIVPDSMGITGYIGGFTEDWYTYYDWDIYGVPLPTEYLTINHRGYFFAPQTGVYDFTFDYVDDKAFLWLGSLAYSGWNSTNKDAYVYVKYGTTGGFTPSLTGGTYYAFRLHWAQGFGPAGLLFHITAPDGTLIASDQLTSNPYFVRYPCDQSLGALYPPFGSET